MAQENGVPSVENLTPHQQAVFAIVRDVLAKELSLISRKIDLDSKPKEDHGADSLETTAIVLSLEDELQIRIPDDEAQGLKTVRDYVNFIVARTDYNPGTNTLTPESDDQYLARLGTGAFTIQQVQAVIVAAVTFNTDLQLNGVELARPLDQQAPMIGPSQRQRLAWVFLALTKPHELKREPKLAVVAAGHIFDDKSILDITAMACKSLALSRRLK